MSTLPEVANTLNKYYTGVAHKLHQSLQKNNQQFKEINNDKSILFYKCSEKELTNIISSLKTSYSAGPDNVNSRDLKEIYPLIKGHLLYAINSCLKTGEFPSSCKVSKVIPLYKKGDREKPENYRPISLTSIFSKILERVMKNRLVKFLRFSRNQYGFQGESSTQSATVDLVENIISKLERGDSVVVVFVDLQKAFDTVKHDILLKKLEKLGVRGPAFKLISSFLGGRSQYTEICGVRSKTLNISTGIPQGSVLGPLLYLLYVESLSRAELLAKHYMFADDTALIYSGKDTRQLEVLVNKDLAKFHQWLCLNGLVVNEDKTVFMHFYQKNKNTFPINLCINHKNIKQVCYYKYLGLTIDDKLTWDKHIDDISNRKLCGLIGALRRVNDCLTVECRFLLYNSYIQSILSYLIVVWANTSVYNFNRLQRLQNKAIKAIFKIPYDTKSGDLYNTIPLLPIKKLKQLELCKLIHKIKNEKIKTNTKLSVNSDRHNYQTRRRDNISTSKIRTDKGLKSPIYQGSKCYNELPQCIRSIEKLDQFVKHLKTYLKSV